MSKGFKKQKLDSSNFKYNSDIVKTEITDYSHPIFCFKYQHPDYDINKCDKDEKASLLEQLYKLSTLTWNEITTTQRHGMGSEKININSIKPRCPSFITEDVEFLMALRFQGKKPFLIHRDKFIAHIIFIDNKYTVYKH